MRSIHVEVRKAVVAGLLAELGADEDTEDVSVTYGWQGNDDTAPREQVFTANARATQPPAALRAGRNFRDEHMQFDVTVWVLGVGMKPEEVEARVMDIGQVVEEFIADHKGNELEVDGLNWLRMQDFAAEYRVANIGGSLGIATYTVLYQARLT